MKLSDDDIMDLLKNGYTSVLVKEKINPSLVAQLPIKFLNDWEANEEVQLGLNPSLLFLKDGVVHFALVNGKVVKVYQK